MGRRRPAQIVVIPAREFINCVQLIYAFIPKGLYMDEANFVSSVFDNVFNEVDVDINDLVSGCIHTERFADVDDISFVKEMLDDSFSDFADLLRNAKDNARSYMPGYNYADLVRISWDTKSLYLKAL